MKVLATGQFQRQETVYLLPNCVNDGYLGLLTIMHHGDKVGIGTNNRDWSGGDEDRKCGVLTAGIISCPCSAFYHTRI